MVVGLLLENQEETCSSRSWYQWIEPRSDGTVEVRLRRVQEVDARRREDDDRRRLDDAVQGEVLTRDSGGGGALLRGGADKAEVAQVMSGTVRENPWTTPSAFPDMNMRDVQPTESHRTVTKSIFHSDMTPTQTQTS